MFSIALSIFAASLLDMTSLPRAISCLHRLPAPFGPVVNVNNA
ncbi:MAG: hypothetical protein VB142_10475 [Burkholderia sp.]